MIAHHSRLSAQVSMLRVQIQNREARLAPRAMMLAKLDHLATAYRKALRGIRGVVEGAAKGHDVDATAWGPMRGLQAQLDAIYTRAKRALADIPATWGMVTTQQDERTDNEQTRNTRMA